MYGSSLRWVTLMPRDSRMAPSEAAAMPLPKEDTTPPVTKTYLVMGTLLRESAMITEEPAGPEAALCGSAASRRGAFSSADEVPVDLTEQFGASALQPLERDHLARDDLDAVAAH